MTDTPTDVIDAVAGTAPAIAALRRTVTREQSQASFDALFSPVDAAAVTLTERWLVAVFATRLTADDATAEFYAVRAREADDRLAQLVLAEADASATEGPFGVYAEAGLQSENLEGPRYVPASPVRETDGASHDALLEAGWSVDGIVTLSQLLAFLAFQQRVAAGLRVLSEVAA